MNWNIVNKNSFKLKIFCVWFDLNFKVKMNIMFIEKWRKFVLFGIFCWWCMDKLMEEVGIDLLYLVDDGDLIKLIFSYVGGLGDEDIGKVRNNLLRMCCIFVD